MPAAAASLLLASRAMLGQAGCRLAGARLVLMLTGAGTRVAGARELAASASACRLRVLASASRRRRFSLCFCRARMQLLRGPSNRSSRWNWAHCVAWRKGDGGSESAASSFQQVRDTYLLLERQHGGPLWYDSPLLLLLTCWQKRCKRPKTLTDCAAQCAGHMRYLRAGNGEVEEVERAVFVNIQKYTERQECPCGTLGVQEQGGLAQHAVSGPAGKPLFLLRPCAC